MKTSQKLNLTIGLGTIALVSACGAKVEGTSIPANLIPIKIPAQQTSPTGTGTAANTGTVTSTNTSTMTSINNPLFGKKFSDGGMFTIAFDYASPAQLNIIRTCALSGDFCQSMGQLDQESFSVKMNDQSSVYSEDFGTGKKALLSATGDDQIITLTSKVVSVAGDTQAINIHKMSFSQKPCGNDMNGAGLEDNFTSTSFFDGGSSDTTSCQALY